MVRALAGAATRLDVTDSANFQSERVDRNGAPAITIHGGWKPEFAGELNAGPWDSITLFNGDQWGDFSFLLPFKDRIRTLSVAAGLDYSPLLALDRLERLVLRAPPRKIGSFDLCRFPHLRHLDVWWHPKYSQACFGLPELEECRIYAFPAADLTGIAPSATLRSLTLDKPAHLASLEGVARLPALRSLAAGPSRSPIDLAALAGCRGLEEIRIESPKGVSGVGAVLGLPQMRQLVIDAPSLQNLDLAPVGRLRNLSRLFLVGRLDQVDWPALLDLPHIEWVQLLPPDEQVDALLQDLRPRLTPARFELRVARGRKAAILLRRTG